jgi:hypothetical protein
MIGAWNPNRPDLSVDSAEFRVDGGLWQPATKNGIRWEGMVDAGYLSAGVHTVYARAYDGRSYSEVAWVQVVVGPSSQSGALLTAIILPPEEVVQSPGFFVAGVVSAPDLSNVWLEVSYDGRAWLPARETSLPNWSFQVNSTAGGSKAITVCVRAVNETTVGIPDCRTYELNGSSDNRAPSVQIAGAEGVLDSAGIIRGTAFGNVSDDSTLVDVFVRIDGGTWERASGAPEWNWSFQLANATANGHVVDAMAFDGSLYSSIRRMPVKVVPADDPAVSGRGDPSQAGLMDPELGLLLLILVVLIGLFVYGVVRRRRFD